MQIYALQCDGRVGGPCRCPGRAWAPGASRPYLLALSAGAGDRMPDDRLARPCDCLRRLPALISVEQVARVGWPMSESEREEELRRDEMCLMRIRQGGSARVAGISELYQRYAKRFVGYLAKHRVPREQAEDLVQNVFVSVVRNCESFRGNTRIDAWIWAIVRNHLIDHFRRARPEETVDNDDLVRLAGATVDPAPGGGLEDCVKAAFARFAEAYRDRAEVMSLVALQGWGIAELAVMLKRTPGATREYLNQCRKKMREYLEPCRQYLEAD